MLFPAPNFMSIAIIILFEKQQQNNSSKLLYMGFGIKV